ncbi:MAG: reverse transcriptase domain-containing protein [Eubacteriales bacterium]|nr:reverse transcriptase domain-containing protein [Eubacteriales bacterium]
MGALQKLCNLCEAICSFENLYAAYVKAAEHKRYRAEVLKFNQNLEGNLFALQRELRERVYKVGPYRQFYVQYPKPRLVMALGFRDRIVQWAIYRQINPYIDKRFITHSYGCREGKGTLAAAETLFNWLQLISRRPDADDWVILKLDVSKYFYRVDHDTVMDVYADYINDEWFTWLLGTIINNPDVPFGLPEGMSASDCPPDERLYDVGMPIGNLTSQETANVYLNKLDQYCKHILKLRYYIRYMDDTIILIKGRKEAERVKELIGQFMRAELRLALNQKTAIYPVRQGCEFVGCVISPHGIRIRKSSERHIKRSLKHVAEMYALGAIDLQSALDTISSYHGLTQHKCGYNLRRWIEENIVLQRKEDANNEPCA